VLLTFLLQLSITYIPFLQSIFKTESLSFTEFVLVGAASALIFVAVEIEKLIRNRT
jgi:Ca2+-transporting ATPase